jgi:hypothetical protein
VLAPLVARAHGIRNVLHLGSLVLGLGFFGSVFLMLATFLYDAFCPTVIKRFAVPIDYFRELTEVSDLARRAGVKDVAPKTFEVALADYDTQARRSPIARLACLVSYAAAGGCVAALLVDRAYEVLTAIS